MLAQPFLHLTEGFHHLLLRLFKAERVVPLQKSVACLNLALRLEGLPSV